MAIVGLLLGAFGLRVAYHIVHAIQVANLKNKAGREGMDIGTYESTQRQRAQQQRMRSNQRPPRTSEPIGAVGWWLASDGMWYPPESAPEK